MRKIFFVTSWFIFLAVPGFAENASNANTITKIEITGNRIEESIIRKNLAFREGDIVDEEKIEKSRANLYALEIFKALDITKEKDESTGGVKIVINARDGWFVLPLPMFGSRGGDRYFACMLLEQNAFKKGERLSAFAMFQDSLSRYALSGELNKYTFSGFVDRRAFTEYQYEDGAYNAQIINDKTLGTLADFGQVVNFYDRDATTVKLSAGAPLGEKLKGSAGVSLGNIQYRNASAAAPVDSGRTNVLALGLQYGRGGAAREQAGFGRLFGLGMADMKEKFKILPRTTIDRGFGVLLETADKAFGSDSKFSKITLTGSRAVNYTDRSRFWLALKAGYGVDVPASQLFATDRNGGLLGVYARQYRGDRLLSANAAYRRPFIRNSTGQLIGEAFCEYAECRFEGRAGKKQGAGCNLAFQFWRFPLPLGFGYTYSFDDKDWEVSFSFGGMF